MQFRVSHAVIVAAAFAILPLGFAHGWLSSAADPLSKRAAGIDLSVLDPSVAACDDFYAHACGGFIAKAKPDASDPSIAMTSRQFDVSLDQKLSALFASSIPNDPELDRLKTFYGSCLNGDANDAAQVKAWLGRIDAANSPAQVQALLRDLAALGVNPFFTYSGQPDRTDMTRYRGEIHNAVLWADKDAVEKTFLAAGYPAAGAARDAATVAAMTSELRQLKHDRWDADTAENPRAPSQIETLAPAVDWSAYLAMAGAPAGGTINVTSPGYLEQVNRELTSRTPAELHAFMRWSFLFTLRGEVPAPYNQAFGAIPPGYRIKLGQPTLRCREATIRAMGVEFSHQYAEHILGWRARAAATQMARSIRETIVASISEDRWLSPAARRSTAAKLRATDLKIGFPDNWPAVGDYPLSSTDFFGNVLAARRYEAAREWHRVGQPHDRHAWDMIVSPWVGDGMAAARLVVPNGFPDAFSNSLIMTAAFLAPPRFDPDTREEFNYATFGDVFAHEFVHVAETHMFGADGRPAELWSKADMAAAKRQDGCVIAQADAFHPAPGLTMSGKDRFDENVADYGGLRLSYQALAKRLGDRLYKREASGLSPAQRFFYKFAHNYCTAQTPENLRQSVAGDHHGPPAFRVNGPISNLPGFARAFNCKPGSRMVEAHQCRVW